MQRGRESPILRGLCLPIVVLLLMLAVPVAAQGGGTRVYFDPASATVEEGETATVDIVVEDVSNLQGVEVHMVFDPSVLEVVDADAGMAGVQVALGPFVSPDFVAQNVVDPGTGRIDFAYSQMGNTPVSGSGVIGSITFRATASGVSPLTFIEVLLADVGGNQIGVTTENGQVTVTAETPTPTATPTPTPTDTPTSTTGAVLSLIPSTSSVAVGDWTEVTLHVANASNLYGVEVHIAYGAGLDWVGHGGQGCIDDVVVGPSEEDGGVQYAASLQAPSAPFEGECDLITLTFVGSDPGTYSIEIASALLSDPDGNSLEVTTQGATVEVVGPTETPTPPPGGECTDILGYHVVRWGETLYAVGRAYGVRPDAIALCNGIINPNLIRAGTTLAIPNAPWSPIPPGPVAIPQFGPGPGTACRYYHTVRWGENLFRISLRYGVSMWTIAEANRIYNLNYIWAGQVLCIP